MKRRTTEAMEPRHRMRREVIEARMAVGDARRAVDEIEEKEKKLFVIESRKLGPQVAGERSEIRRESSREERSLLELAVEKAEEVLAGLESEFEEVLADHALAVDKHRSAEEAP